MKMRNLLFGVFLGLLAVVHSTPVFTLAKDDFDSEASTEEFLADEFLLPSLTTESPKRNATIPATQQPMSESKQSHMTEGSGDELMAHDATTTPTSTTTVLPDDANRVPQSGVTSPSEPDEALSRDNDVIEDTTVMSATPMFFLHGDEHYEGTTPSVPHAQSSTSTPFPMPSDDFSSQSSTTRAPQSGVTSPSHADDDLSTDNVSNDHNSASQTTDTAISSTDWSSGFSSEEGSGSTELTNFPSVNTRFSLTSTSTAETTTASSNSKSRLVQEKIIEQRAVNKVKSLHDAQPDTPESPTNAGHSTPGWIIIVGFIVGIAALVMICVAIATRDKWNGPRQASQPKANPSNQQRELEMETFLLKDNPRENGKAAEYTVIPLDELPEKYSSH